MSAYELTLAPKPGNPRNSEGSFVRLGDGRLLFAWSKFSGGGDDAPGLISCRLGSGDGKSWDRNERILVAREGRQNVMSVSLLRLADRRIALLYLVKNGPEDCRPWLRISDDEAKSWGRPRCLIANPGYHVVNNDRLVQLADGTLIVPVAKHRPRAGGVDPYATLLVLRGTPDAKTWQAVDTGHGVAGSGTGLQEPGIVELPDGRLWCWARTDRGQQWQTFSSDGGKSWPAAEASSFASPCSPLSAKRLLDGRLLAVWNLPTFAAHPATWGRTPLVATLSQDATTWGKPWTIEDDPERGFCYAALFPLDARTVLAAYCAGGAATGSVLSTLVIRRITLG